MISDGGHYATPVDAGEGIPAPSSEDGDLILAAWREALAQVLCSRDNDWRQQLRAIKAENAAAIAELRAGAAEFRSALEAMVEERLAQIRQPADGQRGEPGPRGEPGAPAKFEGLCGYVEGAVRYRGDIVTHRGSTYQAQCDTAKAPPHEDWVCIAAAGIDGKDGRSVRVRGTYKAGEDYAALDVVALNGGSFIARHDNPGDCPGDGWQSQSLPGKKGAPGDRGPKGDRGERGERGGEIVAWDIDRDNYTIAAVLSDQTRSTPLDLGGLFEQYLLERIGRGSTDG
jgi:hypothetical protein